MQSRRRTLRSLAAKDPAEPSYRAAYRLGCYPRFFRVARNFFWRPSTDHSVTDLGEVFLASMMAGAADRSSAEDWYTRQVRECAEEHILVWIDGIEEALVPLAAKVNATVRSALHDLLPRLRRLAQEMIERACSRGEFDGITHGAGATPLERESEDLQSYCGQTLQEGTDHWHLMNLGQAVGYYCQRMYPLESGAPAPPPDGVVRAIAALPPRFLETVPELGRLFRQAGQSPATGAEEILATALGRSVWAEGTPAPRARGSRQSSQSEIPRGTGRSPRQRVRDLTKSLHFRIEYGLSDLRSQEAPLKPRWVSGRDGWELWYGPTLCARYTREAPHQRLILDAFEELGWPPRIDDPLPPGKRADTAKALQKRLRQSPLVIERDGNHLKKQKGFRWRTRPPA
jgi:hypothetical protein